ncbi:MAG TPA: NAD-dependent dehydratase [Sphingomicrobium sp.]|jgi:uncharacterized protein YbjT (DUF2867 family)
MAVRVAMIGATGLIGSRLVPLLEPKQLLLLSRRPSGFAVAEKIAPAPQWPGLLADERLHVAISALGTTWRKAGSWSAFEQVDRVAVLDFAKAAKSAGARQMIVVSSVGADAGSSNEYLALKGRVEADLTQLGFERLDIVRPGLLRGPRGNDRRPGERLGILISPVANLFLRGRYDRFAAIDASVVAAAMRALVGAPAAGTFIHHNRDLRRLASGGSASGA